METGICSQCGQSIPKSDLVLTGDGEICTNCELDTKNTGLFAGLPGSTVAGLVAAIAGFFVHLSISGLNLSGLTIGPIAVLAGALGLITTIRTPSGTKKRAILASAIAIAVGLYHVATGLI